MKRFVLRTNSRKSYGNFMQLWFWAYMLVIDLIVPVTMIIIGRKFIKSPPKKINSVYGYRTAMSSKNSETWKFAHAYCGKVWHICGYAMLLPTVISMLFVFGKSDGAVGTVGGIVTGVQLAAMLCTIIPTELALKKNFDKYGNRR